MLTQVCDPSTKWASRFFTDGQHWQQPGLCPLGVPRLALDPLSTTALLPCTATKDVKMYLPYTEGPWMVKRLSPVSCYPVPSLSTRGLSSVSWPLWRGSCHPNTPIMPIVATPRPCRTALGDHSGCADWTSLPLSCLLLWLYLCSSALTDQPWGARHPETKDLHTGQGCLCMNWMNHTTDSWMQPVAKKKKKN